MSYQSVKLGEAAKFIRGITYKPSELVDNFSENSIVCMRTANVQTFLKQDDLLSVPKTLVKDTNKILIEGDILVSTANSWNLVGKCCWIPKLDYTATAGGFISILRANKSLLDQKYLYYWFNSDKIQLAARNCGRQTTNISNMDLERCLNIQIPLPPLEEQRRIAEILDKADALIQNRKKAIEKLDELLQATFIDMFGDPVTNPKGWEVRFAHEILKIQGGYAFASKDFTNTGIPIIKIGNANKLGFNTDKLDFIHPKNTEKLKQYELYPGDLLISLTGTVGKDDYGNITEVNDNFPMYYLNQRVGKIIANRLQVNKAFIRFLLSHHRIKEILLKNNRGVRQANISNNDIYNLLLPVPTPSAQSKWENIAIAIELQKQKMQAQLEVQETLFKSLQQQAFSGQL